MPNWCRQKVTIEGPGKREAIKNCLNSDNQFDMNKLIPMPKEIDNEPISLNNKEVKQELINKYGADNWYDWAMKYWGTKWNASETEEGDENVDFSYQTPWGVPTEYWKIFSRLYPELTIAVDYADEFEGNGDGKLIFHNGQMDEQDLTDSKHHWDWVWSW